MDELDSRLREMARMDRIFLPPEYEERMDHVEEQIRQGRGIRSCCRFGRRVVLLAAAVAVLSMSVLGVQLWRLQIGDITVGQEESSYRVDGDIPTIPVHDFSDEIAEIMASVPQKAAEQNPWLASTLPGYWFETFDSWTSSEVFVGFQLENPLENADLLEKGNYFALSQDAETLDERSRRHCAVTLNGDAAGNLQSVLVDAGYLMGQTRIHLSISLYPEGSRMEPGTEAVWNGEADFDLSTAVTGSNVPVSLVMTETPESEYYNDFSSADAYFILDHGLYTLHAVTPGRGNAEEAKAVLEKLLILF